MAIWLLPWTSKGARDRQMAVCEVEALKTFPDARYMKDLWPRNFYEACMRAADYEYLYDGRDCYKPGEYAPFCYVRPLSAWWQRHIVGLPKP